MKKVYYLILSLFIFTSCQSDDETFISKNHSEIMSQEKHFKYDNEDNSLIIELEENARRDTIRDKDITDWHH